MTDVLCTVERCFNSQLSKLDPASARTEAGARTGATASIFSSSGLRPPFIGSASVADGDSSHMLNRHLFWSEM